MKNILISAVLVFTAISASAQTRVTPTASAGVDFYQGFGYKSPGYSFGGGLEVFNPHAWIGIDGGYRPSDKVAYGNTYSYGVSASVLGRLPGGFLVGGGIHASKLRFVDLNVDKDAIQPEVTAGWENKSIRITGTRFFTGREEANHTEGYKLITQIYFNSKFRVTSGLVVMTFDTNSYHPEDGRTTSTGTWMGVTYLFN